MRRSAAWMSAAAVVITAAVVVLGPATPASATVRGDAWRSRAVSAIAAFRAADDGRQSAHAYAYMAGASARVYGWSHAWTQSYLSKLYSLQNPDGGYGLGAEYDAFSDGTINASTTSYAVTMADHVGPVLLAGYKAGAVTRDRVQSVVDMLVAWRQLIEVARGVCVSYSTWEWDAYSWMCVHNVNAGVASFLHDAASAGFGATGMHRLITDITVKETADYLVDGRGWPYMTDGSTSVQDPDHEAYTADSMYRLAYWIGREVAYRLITTAYPGDPTAPLAHMRLVSLPSGPGSVAKSGTTIWCELGDQWLSETDAFIASASPTRLAQAAYFSARNMQAC